MERHEVTDDQWELIRPILPPRTARTGRPPSDPRVMLCLTHHNLWMKAA
jgi:transposase